MTQENPSGIMAKASLPPGFRFHPTDVELVCYYLKGKIMGKRLRFEGISEIELYKFAPWDLPEKSGVQSKDLEWYFFCLGNRKYVNGLRKNRATDIGYWKTTGKDRSISYNSQIVAMKKTLVFHLGRAPNGIRTDWVMHEYRLEDKRLADAGFLLDAYVLCRIFKKSGPGPKNGEQRGAPFKEEDWEDDRDNDTHVVSHSPQYSPEYFNVDKLLKELAEEDDNNNASVQENNGDEVPAVANEETTFDGNGIYDDLEDLTTQFELKSAGDIYFSNNMEEHALQHALVEVANQAEPLAFYEIHSSEDRILHHTQLGTNDGSYMEMNDFLFPVEGHHSELMAPGDLFGQNSFQSLSSTNIQALPSDTYTSSSGMEGFSGNAGGQQLADFHGSGSCQRTDEIGSTKSIRSSAGGEQHELPSESLITKQAKSHAKLQYLLSSIRGRPAIAAEYPSALKEEELGGGGGGVSYYGGSIHVKAEVTLRCPCTEDSQLNASDDSLSARSSNQVPSRKIPRESCSSDRGFACLFFLGVLSALMWTLLLSLGAKLGRSAWKLFLS